MYTRASKSVQRRGNFFNMESIANNLETSNFILIDDKPKIFSSNESQKHPVPLHMSRHVVQVYL